MIGLTSYGLSRLPYGRVFLDDARLKHLWPWSRAGGCDAVAGWGMKPSGLRARRLAAAADLPLLLLEDGFLRSVRRGDPALSVVVDDLGIYYDAAAPSRLERLIAEPLCEERILRARAVIGAWRAGRVSKYNHARDYCGDLPARYVLVVDQTFGDASVRHGGADERSFERMVEAALAENEGCTVVVKTHPDVFTRGKRGYFDVSRLAALPRVLVVAQDCHPARLIEHAEKVYTATSQIGFEALIWGTAVRCFGMPFYAGWGLTRDELAAPARRVGASLEQLVHAALVAYPRYVDPETGSRCEVERVIEHVGLQRAMRARFAPEVHAVGFSRWKRPILRRFLDGSRVRFARSAAAVPETATLAVWGSAPAGAHARVLRVEDGFLRSVGLGADLTQPLSWVQDEHGIYYDASRPSSLELLLAQARFEPGLLARASRLRGLITEFEITKYNVGAAGWNRPKTDKKLILVPGQVESDASIRLGTKDISTNAGLLAAARAAAPDAYIVYKPHPDVLAGLRAGEHGEHAAHHDLADEVVAGSSIAPMLPLVDEVHTMTSLVGFEALIRNVKVVCYGQPFYAGWGLTDDVFPIGRRRRRLTLDELVAAALILYPAYVSRRTGRFTTPENAVRELIEWRDRAGAPDRELTVRRLFARMTTGLRERGRQHATR